MSEIKINLASSSPDEISRYLTNQQWLHAFEIVQSCQRAGLGNMNCVIRVATSQRSFILKQSMPWCDRFQDIAAPPNRLLREAEALSLLQENELINQQIPHLYQVDKQNFILLEQDLGECQDLTHEVYGANALSINAITQLVFFLNQLHNHAWPVNDKLYLVDHASRKLQNHYIFTNTLAANNGLNLDNITPGLEDIKNSWRQNQSLIAVIAQLKATHLHAQQQLTHNDFHPGNWLKNNDHLYIIDFELANIGSAEFDLGTLLAHLLLGENNSAAIHYVLTHYQANSKFSWSLTYQFIAIEIMYRLLGIAQLPLAMDLKQKQQLLAAAQSYLLNPPVAPNLSALSR